MIHFLGNGWVIGLGTGVLSGAVVALVTRLILSRRENRDYKKNVDAANREIVYTIRASIPDDQIPSRDVVVALIHSSARRLSVSARDLFGPSEIAEELVKEVMDSSFLSSAKKKEYTTLVLPIGAPPPATGQIGPASMETNNRRSREEVISRLSAVTGAIAGLATMTVALLTVQMRDQPSGWLLWTSGTQGAKDRNTLLLMATVLVLVAVSTVAILVVNEIARRRSTKRPEEVRPGADS